MPPIQGPEHFTVLLLPEFPVWALRHLYPDLRRREVLVASAGRVVARSEGLARQGVEAGWTVPRALARVPQALVRTLAGAEGRLAWEDVLESLNRCSPWIEPAHPGRALVRFGTPAEAEGTAARLMARTGMAADRSTALLAAASAAEGSLVRVGPGEEEEFRSQAPVSLLGEVGVGEATLERLRWLGLSRVGSLARLTRAQLCAQFEEGPLLDTLARCEDRRPVPLYEPPPTVVADQAFEPPAWEPADLEPALRALVDRAAAALQGRRASFLTLRLQAASGETLSSRRVLQAPTADPARLGNPARLALQRAHPGLARRGGRGVEVERLVLALGGLLSPRRVQGRLWAARPGVEEAIQAVEARFPGRLLKIARVDPWAALPEEAATLEPLWRPEGRRGRP